MQWLNAQALASENLGQNLNFSIYFLCSLGKLQNPLSINFLIHEFKMVIVPNLQGQCEMMI